MAIFSKGTNVRQIVTPVTGVVSGDFRVDQETGQVQIPVEWLDDAGELHQRYFDAGQLELDDEAK
jgi:hypothetical protein